MLPACLQQVQKQVRCLMPHLAEKHLRLHALTGGASAEAVYRIDINGESASLVARLAGEFSLLPEQRRRDQDHMRQLMSDCGAGPTAITSECRLTIDSFIAGSMLAPDDGLLQDCWAQVGQLMALIHSCPRGGFQSQNPLLPEAIQITLCEMEAKGLKPPETSVDSASKHWPTSGKAADLVAGHGDFYFNNIIKQEGTGRLFALDFELAGVNFAGFDVAYLFSQQVMYQAYEPGVMLDCNRTRPA